MFTDKRLTEAFHNAKIESFDGNSKYIIFSDCHRGDDSVSDEFIRNQNIFVHALDYYFNHDYRYVEAGDGDELWEYCNFRNIRLAHSDVFKVMKKFYDKNRLILLYGNHDIFIKRKSYVEKNYYEFYDEHNQRRVPLFPGITAYESLVLIEKETGQKVFMVHGHQGDLMNDQLWFLSMLLMRYFWRFLHVVGFQNPSSPAKNFYKRHKVEKNYKKWIHKHKMILICGHTHRAKYPQKKELPYFNAGSCINSRCITGIEIIDGSILMVDWRVAANASGLLYVKRTVVRGPEPLERFNWKAKRRK
ncbi:MAG: metallophosphoesterase family protein [Velocimicrobium sp.]